MSSQETTYACGHIWRTGFNGTPEEQERLKKLVNEKWAKEPCMYCQHFKDEGEIEQEAWNAYQSGDNDPRNQENSIIGKDCECGMPMEEGHVCPDKQPAEGVKVCEHECLSWWEGLHHMKPMAHLECIERHKEFSRSFRWSDVTYRRDSYAMKRQICCLCSKKFVESPQNEEF